MEVINKKNFRLKKNHQELNLFDYLMNNEIKNDDENNINFNAQNVEDEIEADDEGMKENN